MLKILLKVRLQALFAMFFRSSRLKTKKSPIFKIAIGIFALYLFACFCFLFYMLFSSFAAPLFEMGLGWLYFAIAALTSFALCFFLSIFMTQTQLYQAKDNDLLLSMPIAPRDILASRMAMLLLLDYAYQFLLVVPCAYAWWQSGTMTLKSAAVFCLVFLALPFLVVAATAFVGWLVELISSRMKKKNVISMLLSLGFLGAYFYAYSQMQNYINHLLANGEVIADAVRNACPPLYHLGAAIADGNIMQLIYFLLWVIVPFVLVYAVLSRGFIKLATTKRGGAHVQYKGGAMKVSSPLKALIMKELRHLGSSSMYMMNGALGVVLLLIGGVFILLKGAFVENLLAQMPSEINEMLVLFACLALCAMSGTNIISAPSVSLEGKNLWLMQSLPLKNGTALFAKVYAHTIVVLPAVLFAALAVSFALRFHVVDTLLIVLIPAIFTIFVAFLGVVVNLKFPKFDWVSETSVVKQSSSVMITMLCGIGLGVLPGVLYMNLLTSFMSAQLFLLLMGAVFFLISIIFAIYMRGRGARIFAEL